MATRFRNALITGASSGIGRALALELAGRGAHVFAAARRQDELAKLSEEARAKGGKVTGLQLDVTRPAEAVALVHRLQREHDGLDLVVANAGVSGMARASKLTWEKVEPVLMTNVVGACAVVTAAIADMVARKRGTLAGVSSIAGQYGMATAASYSASKAALSTFLQALRPGLKRDGVQVVDIRPGFIHTPMTANSKVPMPLAMELGEAVPLILDGLEAGRPVIAFPSPLAAGTWLLRQLPNGLADALNARMSGG